MALHIHIAEEEGKPGVAQEKLDKLQRIQSQTSEFYTREWTGMEPERRALIDEYDQQVYCSEALVRHLKSFTECYGEGILHEPPCTPEAPPPFDSDYQDNIEIFVDVRGKCTV